MDSKSRHLEEVKLLTVASKQLDEMEKKKKTSSKLLSILLQENDNGEQVKLPAIHAAL